MDYLSGKFNSNVYGDAKSGSKKVRLRSKINFIDFCNTVLNFLTEDELTILIEKYLTAEIISVLKNDELRECINAFFNNNLNLTETSKNAFVHRNTLLYRIEKIDKFTGLNIREFEDAMCFRIMMLIYEKNNKGNKK